MIPKLKYHIPLIILNATILIIFVSSIMQGCSGTDKKTLTLFCGGGIRPPIDEIIELFQKETGVEVEPTYAGSGVLLTQIQLTQKGDLYMPGDEMFILRAEEKDYIDEKRYAAYFVPVIIVQKGNSKGITSLEDMGKHGVRIGVGNPEACAIGEITKSILEKNKLAAQVEENMIHTTVTVIDLANAIKLKTIDAAIVWDATAKLYTDDVEVVPIPQEKNVIARIPIGILSFSKNKKLARKFIDFIASDLGRRIFEKHGYTTKIQ